MKRTRNINKTVPHESIRMRTLSGHLRSNHLRMNGIIYLSLVLPLIFFSCESTPEAHFRTDPDEPEVGQEVLFTNDSHNANRFEWDFGDGYVSSEEDPVHYYTATGTFEVVLTAFSRSGISDVATMTIKIYIPSILVIEVLEYRDGYVVPNASVYLFPDITSWDNEENLVAEGYTENNGQVVFSHLDYKEYYVDVLEEHHNNYALRDENVGFIITEKLERHKVTYYVAWVDYFETKKGDGRRDNSYVIKKLERKTADKVQPPLISDTEDWQSLYDKSIKLR